MQVVSRPVPGLLASLVTTPVTSFDLRAMKPADDAWKRGGLLYVSIVTATLTVELVALAWATLESASRLGASFGSGDWDLFLMGGIGAALGFGVLGIRRLLPGATQVEMDGRGVHLTYRRGRREDLSWQLPGFVLCDYREVPEMVEGSRALSLRGPHFWDRRTLLTPEAFDAILRSARTEHADVTLRTARGSERVACE
jgi:hypothetical protein